MLLGQHAALVRPGANGSQVHQLPVLSVHLHLRPVRQQVRIGLQVQKESTILHLKGQTEQVGGAGAHVQVVVQRAPPKDVRQPLHLHVIDEIVARQRPGVQRGAYK